MPELSRVKYKEQIKHRAEVTLYKLKKKTIVFKIMGLGNVSSAAQRRTATAPQGLVLLSAAKDLLTAPQGLVIGRRKASTLTL